MTAYYDITEKLKELLDEEPLNNTVVLGDTDNDLDEVDTDKHVHFPLTHIIVQSATVTDNTILFDIDLLSLDVVDFNKEAAQEPFKRNDNQQNVLNERLALLVRVYKKIRKNFKIYDASSEMSLTPLNEYSENNLAGWRGSFQIITNNTMTRC
jgi:hypothetical protein